MKKGILKIFTCIIFISVLFINCNVVKADTMKDVIKGGDDFITAGEEKGSPIDDKKLQKTSTSIYNILLTVAMAVAVVISSVLGLKFMLGSVEEKAKIKESLVPFIIGCIVVFGSFGIWKIVVTIGKDLL